jgi:hypothetical protein
MLTPITGCHGDAHAAAGAPSCTHYVTSLIGADGDPDRVWMAISPRPDLPWGLLARAGLPAGLEDPERLLDRFQPGELVTILFDVFPPPPERRLLVRAAGPASGVQGGQLKTAEAGLKHAGWSMWWAEEHAAWTARGWLDIEALEGE